MRQVWGRGWRIGVRHAGAVLCAFALAAGAQAQPRPAACSAYAWPHWEDFLVRFVQPDGRVVDTSTPQSMTTSEGQSYGMFFALVANDPDSFERLWRWSQANLGGAQAEEPGLPAWSWGRREDGSWGVLDRNAASDADLWFAYGLLEAARLWRRPDYTRDAQALLAQIRKREITVLPGFGAMLLPGPAGFVQPGPLWRLNPSYLPVPLLRRLAQADAQGPWEVLAGHTVQMVQANAPRGYIADWIAYRGEETSPPQGRFEVDPLYGARGSYDAIRNYLWAGMTPPTDPAAQPLLAALYGMEEALAARGMPPEAVQVDSGELQGEGPFGFSAALLPYLQARGQNALLQAQLQRVRAALAPGQPQDAQPRYYDYVLSLFGLGWFEQRYRFAASGRVTLEWEKKCP